MGLNLGAKFDIRCCRHYQRTRNQAKVWQLLPLQFSSFHPDNNHGGEQNAHCQEQVFAQFQGMSHGDRIDRQIEIVGNQGLAPIRAR